MCGIFAYIGQNINTLKLNNLIQRSEKIVHRGPDSSNYKVYNDKVFFGFHRLAINGLNPESDQPLESNDKNVVLICNGEIFNFKELIKEYNLENEYKTESDCEIIIHLYKLFGIEKTCQLLDGEFAFILYDIKKDIVYTGRDQIGVRSLYYIEDIVNDEFYFCSEMKGLIGIETNFKDIRPIDPFCARKIEEKASKQEQQILSVFDKNNCEDYNKYIQQFPVASFWSSDYNITTKYFSYIQHFYKYNSYEEGEKKLIEDIRELFTKSVEKRLLSDRKLACLLSGGLDSTTVTAIVASYYEPYTLNTYSIGLKGSEDLFYAKVAAEYLKTNHVSIELSEDEFLGAIEKTIKQIESYDTTTVRASVGNYLVSLFIKENSDDTVIFCGDVSDELFASYRGFEYASNDMDFYRENIGMLDNIQYFDVLRSDKSIAGAGLEARVPFADINFIKYCMGIDPKYKRFFSKRGNDSESDNKIEKYLFRKAFEHLLPPLLAWRVKTAFSDGVSNKKKPWYQIIKDFMDQKYSDADFEEKKMKYTHNQPYDKESLYYREIYEMNYPNTEYTIPYFWKQPFTKEADPSAWVVQDKKEIKEKFMELV
jgi:asparagine synthase (glutamine-hydrolysing)